MFGSEQPEIRARSYGARCQVHQRGIRNIAVGKNDGVDLLVGDDLLQIFLFKNGDALGIKAAGKFRRILPARNVGNLGRCEGHYVVVKVVAEERVEVVEVAPGGSED